MNPIIPFKKIARLFVFAATVFAAASCNSKKEVQTGIFDAQSDIGYPKLEGSARFDASSGTYYLTAAGTDVWNRHDEFLFLSKRIAGDFVLSAQVKFVGDNEQEYRKLGLMAREELFSGSAHVSAVIHGGASAALQYRSQRNKNTNDRSTSLIRPTFVQLERRGNLFRATFTAGSDTVETVDLTDVELNSNLWVGLFVCSHNENSLDEAQFEQVKLEQY